MVDDQQNGHSPTVASRNSLAEPTPAPYAADVPEPFFHVSSTRNRESIARHGLDWTRMGTAPGIAGSERPEAEDAFVCRGEFELSFFLRMNNTGGPVDVWGVDGVDEASLVDNGNGFVYVPGVVSPRRVRLVRPEAQAPDW